MSETKYTADHEWIRTEGDVATIGITDFAQAALGDVVFVDLPGVGRTFASGEAIGEIESTKSVGELYAPVDGQVVEANQAVIDAPDLVVPHPRMHERAFVLAPLAEIAPALSIPHRGPIQDCLARCADQRIERIATRP